MMVFLAGVVGVAGTTGVLRAADRRTDDIVRVGGLELVLTSVPDDGPAENYLLVGSDTREGVDPNSPDFGGIGDTAEVSGRRSDTIMILRREKDGGAALLSLPRDLWVEIAGTGESNRINSAYSDGPQQLASTITQALGIPIHHYVEVDFVGFKRIIDQIGGVEICIEFATRDLHTGLDLQPGCQKLDGVQSLAYARSRYYEEFRDGEWRIDPRSDLGRIERQQLFMRAAVNGALVNPPVVAVRFRRRARRGRLVGAHRCLGRSDQGGRGTAPGGRREARHLHAAGVRRRGQRQCDPAPGRRLGSDPRLLPRCRTGPPTHRDLVHSRGRQFSHVSDRPLHPPGPDGLSYCPRMSENLRLYTTILFGFEHVLRSVPADAWENQSPCEEWTTRQVAGHAMGVVNNVAARGGVGALVDAFGDVAAIAGADPVESFRQIRDRYLDGDRSARRVADTGQVVAR